MKKQMKMLLTLALMALMVVSFVGCDLLEAVVEAVYFTEVDGKVVNAMVEASAEVDQYKGDSEDVTLVGSTIYFYPETVDKTNGDFALTTSLTATVDSLGNYSVAELPQGKYKITGEQQGWSFVPRVLDIAGEKINLPPLIAYPTPTANQLTILLSWDDPAIDLDGFVTFYDGDIERDFVGYISATEDNFVNPNITVGSLAKRVDNTNTPIEWERDVTVETDDSIPRVEAITIPWDETAPYVTSTNSTDGIDDNLIKYYVNCYNTNYTLTGYDDTDLVWDDDNDGNTNDSAPGSFAQVDVMMNYDDGTTVSFGSYPLPWNTASDSLNVVDIIVYSDGFEAVPGSGDYLANPGSLTVRSIK